MKLTDKQIARIDERIPLDNNRTIVGINVSGDQSLSDDEYNFNIYCVDRDHEIIWQVTEIGTTPIDGADCFVYIGKNDNGEFIADRFSGFEYTINPDTGEAIQSGFHK